MQQAGVHLLDLLVKGFIVRRLRISVQYARSSRLALHKNLQCNDTPSYCIATAELSLLENAGENNSESA